MTAIPKLYPTGKFTGNPDLNGYNLIGLPRFWGMLVEKVGSVVQVLDKNNNIVYSGTAGTDDAAAINYALTNLTGGRGHKETVVVKGDYNIEASVVIYSYTILDLSCASLFLKNSVNDEPITTESGVHDADLIGGIVDGNKANNTTGTIGVNFINATDCNIIEVKMQNATLQGIALNYGGARNTIAGCKVTASGNDGIITNGTTDSNIIGCHSYGNSHGGFDFYDGSTYITVIGCHATSNIMSGFSIESATAMSAYINLIGCKSSGNGLHGVVLATTGAAAGPQHCTISGGSIRSNQRHGIDAVGAYYMKVIGVTIEYNNAAASTYDGIALEATARCLIDANTIIGHYHAVEEVSGAVYSHLLGNIMGGCSSTQVVLGGTGTTDDHNEKF
jgi:hypothetical protein